MSELQVALTNTAGLSSIASFWVFVGSNAFRKRADLMARIATGVMVLGFVCLTVAIVIRGLDSGRFPLSNLYESLLWFAWAIMGGYLYLATSYNIKSVGWLASLTAAVFFLYGSWLPAGQQAIKPLVPALVSYWRQIHVPPLIVSYALFFIAGLAAFVQLWAAGRTRSIALSVAGLIAACSAIGLGTYTATDTYILQALFVGGSILGVGSAWWQLGAVNKKIANAARAELYDEVVYRAVMVGFPLLTIGIITGALWANHAWGTYWSWDPKESMALVTWLSYAAYIHLRIHREYAAEKLSLVAVAGMLLTLLTYLGFNSLGFGGLHSYGRFKETSSYRNESIINKYCPRENPEIALKGAVRGDQKAS
jgi:cytochrome c-type biogenesis protein CcsB